jgi:hypothetical protein
VFCKLPQSQTPEEKEAFLWFAGEFLQTMCGKRAWGARKKYRSTISDATSSETGTAIVTVTDKAFALLLYEAYIDKWIKRYHEDRRGNRGHHEWLGNTQRVKKPSLNTGAGVTKA